MTAALLAAGAVVPAASWAASSETWTSATITPNLVPGAQNGWVSGTQLRDQATLTAVLPGINKSGDVCRIGYGLYGKLGTPMVTQSQGRAPKLVKGTRVCVSDLSSSSTTFTPARGSGASGLAKMASGAYYINGWEQTGPNYQNGQYVWVTGGRTSSARDPAGKGLRVYIDNSTVKGSLHSPISSTYQVAASPALPIAVSEPYSGIAEIACTDTVNGSVVSSWTATPGNFPATYNTSIPQGYFPDDGVSTITCAGVNAVHTVSSLGTVKLYLIPNETSISATVATAGRKVTTVNGKHAAKIEGASNREVTITGTLKELAGGLKGPASGQQVDVTETISATGQSKMIATAKTNGSGHFTIHLKGGPSRYLAIWHPQSATLGGSAADVLMRAKARMSLHLPGSVAQGQRVTLSGHVFGGYIPKHGLTLQLQFRVGNGRWSNFGRNVHVNSHGNWRRTIRLTASAGYTYQFRATSGWQENWGYNGGSSNVVVRRIG